MKKANLIIMMAALAATSCGDKVPQLGKNSIDEVVNAMTLEEKVHLLIGGGQNTGSDNQSAVVGKTEDLVPGAAGTTYAIPRLGIPSIVLADGPAGLRINPTRENDTSTYYATHFPIGTLLASTWNTDLVEQVGDAIGNEVLEYGVDVLLAPGMNIQRHPLNGRNFEYYSEDPVVSGKIAAAYVKGIQKNEVGTSVKHFVANNQETNRTAVDAIVSQRALREIYLKGFEIAVKESKPWTLMTSYNLVNGTYAPENKELVTGVLRDEWGFEGAVMTDWFGGKSAPATVLAGNDMLQPGFSKQYDAIIEAVNNGEIPMEVIDSNVRRILELIVRTPRFKGYKYSNHPDLKAHAAITRQSATEGMILLKNDNKALPFAKTIKNVALFGVTSYDFIPGGTGSGNVNGAYTVSLLEGLENAGYASDGNLKKIYEKHIADEKERIARADTAKFAAWLPPTRPDELTFNPDQINTFAETNDVAIITIGRYSGEFVDRTTDNFNLSANMLNLIANVSKTFKSMGKPVVVIMNVGGAMETASWKAAPDAILLAWQGGQEGGNSVADILCGKVNPSGKLTMTFPLKVTDPYSSIDFPIDIAANVAAFMDLERKRGNERNVDYTLYEDDIYVGYRYFDTFNVPVSYPFGFGLSYTTFEYSDASVDFDGKDYTVKVKISNTGDTDGKEVVQLYVASPDAKTLNQPNRVLKAFAKTKLLKPGENETLTMKVAAEDLAFFNEEASAWIVNAGEYKFEIGASSQDIRSTLKADVKASERKVTDLLRPRTSINRLTRK